MHDFIGTYGGFLVFYRVWKWVKKIRRKNSVFGIFGIGGERRGEIKILTKETTTPITEDMISDDCKGKILVGGSFLSYKAFMKAQRLGAIGIVVGVEDKGQKLLSQLFANTSISNRVDKEIWYFCAGTWANWC